ncbi:MAG: sigma-54-dependent Fis family transcriptional regulator, partial [Deltaproteobacteria bacterium]|nr:sigma-54-dependent Fis family transcriptional regulator [Deltaproteobacteria bacterium]
MMAIFEGMVGRSKALQDIITFIIRVADEDDPVLIQGETGTGKELIAKAIHNQSVRKDEPFVVVDCSNMLPIMKGSMLFGQEETAFPGAAAYKGKLETVRNGTLFLDHVDALYRGLQEMLIPVMKEKRFGPIGGKADIPLRARIVSATNEDLAHLVSQGGFIPGLYSQLKELYMEVPPLRERKEDIPLLVDHFIRENWNRKKRGPKGISE